LLLVTHHTLTFPKRYLTVCGKVFRRPKRIKPTLIIVCNRCGGLFLAAEGQKTKTCSYCGARVDVRRAKKVAAAESAFEASEILRDIKSKKGFSRE
jgi:DNA-directed RNA polymerase subunit RPC12/RpoP